MRILLFITTVAFLSFAAKGQTSQDKAAVEKVVIAFQEHFNEGSFKNAINYSTHDWVHINPGGGIDKGRDSVLKVVRDVHQTFLKGVSMTVEDMTIRLITPDVAIADVIHKVSTYTTPDGTTNQNNSLAKTYVIVRQKGNWLLAQDHATTIQPTGPATK